MRNVDTKAVMTVRMKLPIFSALGIRNSFIVFFGLINSTENRNYETNYHNNN